MVSRGTAAVPASLVGCWMRRYIRFKDGHEDRTTRVIWLQTPFGLADMRIAAERPDLATRQSLQDCTVEELIALAAQDCGCGVTLLDTETKPHATATWERGEHGFAIQPVVNFPEPGWMEWREDGTCMMEWAPSGAYEEDWRLQPNSQGFAAHLALLDAPAKTSVYVAGDHAIYARDRLIAIEEEVPLQELADRYRDSIERVTELIDCEFSYAKRAGPDADYVIELSTFPWREGCSLSLQWIREIDPQTEVLIYPQSGSRWQVVSLCQQ